MDYMQMAKELIEEFRAKLHAMHCDLEAVYKQGQEHGEILAYLLEKANGGDTVNIS